MKGMHFPQSFHQHSKQFQITTFIYNNNQYYPMNRKQSSNSRNKQDQHRPNYSSYGVDAHKQRVTQTNMVYLIGLPESIAQEKTLKRLQYCGQYGKIIKILVKDNYINDFSSYSAYVTYQNQQSASLAILVQYDVMKGLNNLTIQKNKIYASYGTNKYCSTFIRFGKCKKSDCPFLHKIQKNKEIQQQDNKKLFQDQQELARKFFIENYKSMEFPVFKQAVFPSKYEILQQFIEDGSIIQQNHNDQAKAKQQHTPRNNAMKEIKNSTEISTECSPPKQCEEPQSNESKIKKRITKKVKSTKYSLFSFAKAQSTVEFEVVTKHLTQYLNELLSI